MTNDGKQQDCVDCGARGEAAAHRDYCCELCFEARKRREEEELRALCERRAGCDICGQPIYRGNVCRGCWDESHD